jgi:uncharacterized membrane protein
MNFLPHVVILAILGLIVGGLAIYRRMVAEKEDDTVHLTGSSESVKDQVAIAAKLNSIDKWGKILTVLLVVYGLVIAGLYVYEMWVVSSTTPQFK